jgi:photosystem II stability/assembly factor-like uncharacterized protein
MATGDVLLTVGTKKGAFTVQSTKDRRSWEITGPMIGGQDVNHLAYDARDGRLYAVYNDAWFGPQVKYSTDMGANWLNCASSPRFKNDPVVKDETDTPWFMRPDAVVERFWFLAPGPASKPKDLYVGVAPATLFKSSDGGGTWEELTGLGQHPTRDKWNPGAGGLMVHSLVQSKPNPAEMWVAISAAGIFKTDDGGKTWQTKNSNLRDIGALFDPNLELYPDVGQCMHHLVATPVDNKMYAQGHLGTYRTDDGGESWVDITAGLPSEFGLAMAAHPSNPDMAYVIPLQGGEMRCPPEFALRVYRTADGGKNWQPMKKGLPQKNAFMGVYRQSLCTDTMDPAGVYFGTNTGQLWNSRDDGESWELITHDLPPVMSVDAYVLE